MNIRRSKQMRDFQNLINDFNLHNLLTVVKICYGYCVFAAIVISIIWLLKYFNSNEPSGVKITEMFDENGEKKAPINLKPVFKVVTIIAILIVIYFALSYYDIEQLINGFE
jgi:quinol-cytochrome oxidoreductase complex cytochrome b subunit